MSNDPIRDADQAQRILRELDEFGVFRAIEGETIRKLCETQLDGKAETERYVLELVRVLQANHRQRRFLSKTVEYGRLDADNLERRRKFKAGGI